MANTITCDRELQALALFERVMCSHILEQTQTVREQTNANNTASSLLK